MGQKKIILVDTDIFIKVFRGNAIHKKHLDYLEGRIAISIITALELYQGVNSKKRKYELEKQLKAYQILLLTDQISLEAMSLMKKYVPENILLPPDGLIAATALGHQLELYTDNKKDFDFIKGLKFYAPV
jgi:tRNA(fMet)-specific endonuclease VapC